MAMFAIVVLLFFFLWYAEAASFIAYNDYDRRATSLLDTAQRERERTVVLMYHKPPNVITSHSNSDEVARSSKDPNTRRTVYEDIYSMKGFISGRGVQDTNSNNFAYATKLLQSKMHAIGRLDVDTTGLLLLTNDGALVHMTTNPTAKDRGGHSAKQLVQKKYEAVIMGHHELDGSTLQQLMEGVDLGKKYGGQTKPVDDLTILSHPSRSTTLVSITISEGKNRQVRRMFHAVGSGVIQLHRVSVGKLNLNGLKGRTLLDNELKQGEWRLLTQEEIEVGLGWKCRCLDDDFERGKHKVPGKIRRRRKVRGTNRKARR